MLLPRLLLIATLISLSLPLSACTGGGAQQASDTVQQEDAPATSVSLERPGFNLPAPADLPVKPAPRTAAYTEESLFEEGYSHESGLPHQNYDDSLPFTGEFAATAGNGLNGAAFAVFQFTVDGYDRLPQLRYRWQVEPDPVGAAWIGLANYQQDRWDWWQCDKFGWFPFGDITPYSRPADDAMYAAVVVAGSTTTGELRYLRLGPSGAVARLTPFPAVGIAPLDVTLNGGSSSSSPGSISEYSWDFDGDGKFDETGGTPSASHVYSEPGVYQPRLMVESGRGELDSTADHVEVYAPWTHSWGGSEGDPVLSVAAEGDAVYAAGYTHTFSDGTQAGLLLKYGLDGGFQWARVWDGPGHDIYTGVAASGNSVFTAGQLSNLGAGGQDVLIQRWDADGSLLWTRTWGKANNESASAVAVRGGVIYVCGFSHSMLDFSGDALLSAWDFDGNHLWTRMYGTGGSSDEARGIDTVYDFSVQETKIYLAGATTAYGSTNHKALYAEFSEAGEQLSQQSWDNGDETVATAITVNGLFGSDKFLVAEVGSGADYSALLLEVGSSPVARIWGGQNMTTFPNGIQRIGDSLFVVSYAETLDEQAVGQLCEFNTAGALQGARQISAEDGRFALYGLANFPGRGLICGGWAKSAVGEWTTATVFTGTVSIEWDTQATTAYDPEPLGPIIGEPDLPPSSIENGVHDAPPGGLGLDALISVVAS